MSMIHTHVDEVSCGLIAYRMKPDSFSSLSPSYRILFRNFDLVQDQGKYPNLLPLHLKCVAVTGLPLDDMPRVEVWSCTSLLFDSHGLSTQGNRCKWQSDYGDGVFRVQEDMCGDFSVMCRFGGSHANVRDSSTLIFKYQNSTGSTLRTFLTFIPIVIQFNKRLSHMCVE